MNSSFLTILLVCSSFTLAQARPESITDREIELERLLLECRSALQEGREETVKNRRLLRECLKKLEEQERASWRGNGDFKVALLFKLGTVFCLYQNYQEPALGYKIAALVCLWLI